ncbi:MAG: hypothetical protein V4517_24420 [Pseudomonadota bacterium]
MSLAVKLIDQTPGGPPAVVRHLRLASERITLRELLARRIDEEVAAFNAGSSTIQPLIVPDERERRLNERTPKPRRIEPDRQLAAAIEAFERNRIMVIVDNRQIEDLDVPLGITSDSEVRFLKMVPLVGG